MRFLPVFLDLHSGPIILIGEGELVRAKLRLLLSAGARIRWYATDGNRDTTGLDVADVSSIEHAAGDPLTADLSGVVAILCAGAGAVGHAMSARAKALGLPVNVMDDLEHSTFIFPAIVDRGDVMIAVGTGGTSPVVARRVREKIEAILPARIGDLAGFIGRWRKPVNARITEVLLRRRFWERVVDGPIGALVLEGRGEEAEQALHAIADPSAFAGAHDANRVVGHVTLVGAGPGDPDLLTIKALRALQDADVVFYDEAISPEILDRIRRDASRVPVGHDAANPDVGHEAIDTLLIAAAQSGQRVVRLNGGDAFIFGRGGEQVAALRQAGVAYSIIPGITTVAGGAAQFEIPLTHRDEAIGVVFLTAHDESAAAKIDWRALADTRTTGVVHMATAASEAIREGLLAAGRSPQTPVGVFARATQPGSQAVVGTLDTLSALVAQVGNAPAILVIGEVVAHSAPWRNLNLSELPHVLVAAE